MFIAKKITKRRGVFLLPLMALLMVSCTAAFYETTAQPQQPAQPKLGFTTENCVENGNATIPISERVDNNLLWDDVVSLVYKRFEIEVIQKESGYIRTAWNKSTTTGAKEESERTRVTLRIAQARRIIEVKTEAEKTVDGVLQNGCDTKVLETMKGDLRGLSGY